jgi:GNAT superfamily N-acetyltransferase
VDDAVPELDQRLSDELDLVNAEATRGTAPSRELTVQILDANGKLAAGMSGWTWGVAAGIGMTWVRADTRGAGLGTRLLDEFETEAKNRGCTHVFVTSFTFQAPGFYERHGYGEISVGRMSRSSGPPTCTSARTSEPEISSPVRTWSGDSLTRGCGRCGRLPRNRGDRATLS